MNTKPARGLRSFYPTDKGPIDTYQLGHDGRIEYIAAEIGIDHLKKGINTTDEWKKWAKERGTPTDEPGLIISKRLGGSGIDSVNLFPKSTSMDKTTWFADEEIAYNEAADMKKWKKIKFFAKFDYPEDDSLRPSDVEYQYELPSGTVLHKKVKNEIVSVGETKKVEEEEEEESEYEYEEEEEEVEEVPEEPQPKVVSEVTKPVVSKAEENPKPVEPVRSRPIPPAEPSTIVPPSPRAPSPPANQPPPPSAPEYKREEYSQPKPEEPPSPQTQKSPSPVVVAEKSGRLFAQSDIIEMLPIIGSLKFAHDTVKALVNRDAKLAFMKALQCGISLMADFMFMRAIVRHGRILVKPITEKKIIGFVNKAEPQIIVFGACKVGNQVLSSFRRIFS